MFGPWITFALFAFTACVHAELVDFYNSCPYNSFTSDKPDSYFVVTSIDKVGDTYTAYWSFSLSECLPSMYLHYILWWPTENLKINGFDADHLCDYSGTYTFTVADTEGTYCLPTFYVDYNFFLEGCTAPECQQWKYDRKFQYVYDCAHDNYKYCINLGTSSSSSEIISSSSESISSSESVSSSESISTSESESISSTPWVHSLESSSSYFHGYNSSYSSYTPSHSRHTTTTTTTTTFKTTTTLHPPTYTKTVVTTVPCTTDGITTVTTTTYTTTAACHTCPGFLTTKVDPIYTRTIVTTVPCTVNGVTTVTPTTTTTVVVCNTCAGHYTTKVQPTYTKTIVTTVPCTINGVTTVTPTTYTTKQVCHTCPGYVSTVYLPGTTKTTTLKTGIVTQTTKTISCHTCTTKAPQPPKSSSLTVLRFTTFQGDASIHGISAFLVSVISLFAYMF